MREAASPRWNRNNQLALVFPNHIRSRFTYTAEHGLTVAIHATLSYGVNIRKTVVIPVDAVNSQVFLTHRSSFQASQIILHSDVDHLSKFSVFPGRFYGYTPVHQVQVIMIQVVYRERGNIEQCGLINSNFRVNVSGNRRGVIRLWNWIYVVGFAASDGKQY